MKMLRKIREKAMAAGVLILVGAMWGGMPVSAAEASVKPELKDSVQNEDNTLENEENEKAEAGNGETGKDENETENITEAEVKEPAVEADKTEEEPAAVDPDQFQTVNLADRILTDWQQISEALRKLTPEMIAGADVGSGTLVLQLKNVENIPAELKDGIVSGDSGYAKIVQCGLGSGVSLVLNGTSDISGFHGISNTRVSVSSERRGKKSIATTVRFESHEDIGAVASLQVNLPECSKGTKVSVYAETVAMDEEGNITVGENACIGTTKAGENGNVEIPIQSTANYMFVYKE